MAEDSKQAEFDWGWKVKAAVRLASWLRIVPGGRRLLADLRNRAVLGLTGPLHEDAIHTVRRLAVEMGQGSPDAAVEASNLAFDFCTQCRSVMGCLLELDSNDLHCCWKVILEDGVDDDASELIATWARSRPMDNRPVEENQANAHSVSKNTVWSALYGRNDGKTNWQPFPCFGCNDLTRHGTLFCCDRDDWPAYYRSTLVFPLRFAKNEKDTQFINIGFLAFDSPRINAFGKIPDIFDFREQPTEYRDRMNRSAAFHIGAILADTLSLALRFYYLPRVPKSKKDS